MDQRCELTRDASVVVRVAIPGCCHHELLLPLMRNKVRTQLFRVSVHTAQQLSQRRGPIDVVQKLRHVLEAQLRKDSQPHVVWPGRNTSSIGLTREVYNDVHLPNS